MNRLAYVFCIFVVLSISSCSTLPTKEITLKTRLEKIKIIGFGCILYANKSEMFLPDNLIAMKSELQGDFNFREDINLNDYELLAKGSFF